MLRRKKSRGSYPYPQKLELCRTRSTQQIDAESIPEKVSTPWKKVSMVWKIPSLVSREPPVVLSRD